MAKPDFVAMTPREYEKDGQKQTYWTEVGSAWKTKSGEGINVTLQSVPLDGKFTLFPPKDGADKTPKS